MLGPPFHVRRGRRDRATDWQMLLANCGFRRNREGCPLGEPFNPMAGIRAKGAALFGWRGRRKGTSERGATMVEFALVLPLLLLLTFGIIEFAFVFNANSNVAHSSRAGGRTAGISSLDPQMEFKAAQAAANSLNVSASSVAGQPSVCVGKYNPASPDPCGDYSTPLTLVHP